ncbi:MAG TPA: nicotinate phosphoribosyltransferase [Candidatus Deferrimicrobiaceae bacterium]|jgi:nicotinate phosphoribosyltransferase
MVDETVRDIIPSWEEICRGDTTDVYFPRTMDILRKLGRDRLPLVMEGYVKRFPAGYGYAVLAGMDEMLALLAGRGVTVRAMPEGTIFFPGEPVFSVEGPYGEFCEMETAMLGLLCQASGIATKAARLKTAGGDRPLMSFGARRMHPALSTLIDRNAFIGGADSVSAVRSARYLGEPPSGTMPHALVLAVGDTVEAMRAFDETVEAGVPRVCLVDTLQDEKFEALRVAEALGSRLAAVRLDTPASRRGDFRWILQELRWELDLRGFSHVRLYVSGGLDEPDLEALRDVVDGFGVGTCLSNAPTIDFALDIVEIEGAPFAKRGKCSGVKETLHCPACGARRVVPAGVATAACPCGAGPMTPLLSVALRDGVLQAPPRPFREIRAAVLAQVDKIQSGSERKA